MSISQFNHPILQSNGDLVVSGPFDAQLPTNATVIGEVTVRFLIMQDAARQGDPPLIVDDVASWTSGANWEKTVPASKAQGIQPGKARGIGVAIVIKNFPPGTDGKRIPPAFETLTWCHDTQIDPQGSAS